MPILTYPHLGIDTVRVGEPLGCDTTGWPYRVEQIEHDGPAGRTRITVEPWPIPGPLADEMEKLNYVGAMQHAGDRLAGRLIIANT